MDIQVLNQQSKLPICPEVTRLVVEQVLSFEGQKTDEVAVHFVEREEICRLHDQFFDDPSSTDCITLPIDGPFPTVDPSIPHVLGELFVCPEVAIEYATEEQGDPYRETTLYLVHALLHLMGYEDKEEKAILAMRQAEKQHLANLEKTVGLLHG